MDRLALSESLSPEGRARLERGMKIVELAKGATAVQMGEPISGAYLVRSGELRVYSLAEDGQQTTLYRIGPGETCVIALNCLFNDLLYPAYVEAQEDSRVGVIPGAVYRALFEREKAVQDLTIRALSTAVFRLMAEMQELHCARLDQRLANFLIARASGEGEVRLTQREIAENLGASREAVARGLSGFARDGLVASSRGCITLRAPQRLAEFASRGR